MFLPILDIEEADIPGRSPSETVFALFDVVYSGETEPVIDMYERAAWRAGAIQKHTQAAIRQARTLRKSYETTEKRFS
jgi:hypothetical protein